jgi:uncharacterized protein (TIGR02145 family)
VVKTWGGATKSATNPPDNTTIANDDFIYILPPPTVTAVDPTNGTRFGGTLITIAGANFVAGATVVIGDAACTSPTVVSDTTITCTTSAKTAGTYPIVVTTANGVSTNGIQFTYRAPYFQEVTNANCPTTRDTAIDSRNNQTYYIQSIGNLCWMLSNLRYAGTNPPTTDESTVTVTLSDNTTATYNINISEINVYTRPEIHPDPPGGSPVYTDTTIIGGFYGYLYNWCAAMGGAGTGRNPCAAVDTPPTPNAAVTICPVGWRLPTGGSGGEFAALYSALGGALGYLRATWLGVYSGLYYGNLSDQGNGGYFWSSTPSGNNNAYEMSFTNLSAYPSTHTLNRRYGMAVRCVAGS